MPNFTTKDRSVTNTIYVWAIPNINGSADEEPFYLELRCASSKPWRDGAVCIYETEVSVVVPSGINLIAKALETLRAAKQEALAECEQRCQEIDKSIDKLLMLTYTPGV